MLLVQEIDFKSQCCSLMCRIVSDFFCFFLLDRGFNETGSELNPKVLVHGEHMKYLLNRGTLPGDLLPQQPSGNCDHTKLASTVGPTVMDASGMTQYQFLCNIIY